MIYPVLSPPFSPACPQGSALPSVTVTFLAAAKAVLKQSKRPLTAREITDAATKRGLISTVGKTPWETMKARLYAANKTDPEGPIQREGAPGPIRAARNTVRWYWNGG